MIPKSLRPSSLVVGAAAVVAVPVVLPVLAGIAAGSVAAKEKPPAATTGYGMPVVSRIQRVGPAPMPFVQGVTVAGTTTGVTSGFQAAGGRLLGKGGPQGNPVGAEDRQAEKNEPETDGSSTQLWKILVPVAVGVTAVVAVPVVVGALGFGAGGIAAGSLAAKGMSLAATTGYGMPIVSLLQSVGAAGMTFAQGATVVTTAAVVTSGFQAAGGRTLNSGGPQENPVGAEEKQAEKNEVRYGGRVMSPVRRSRRNDLVSGCDSSRQSCRRDGGDSSKSGQTTWKEQRSNQRPFFGITNTVTLDDAVHYGTSSLSSDKLIRDALDQTVLYA